MSYGWIFMGNYYGRGGGISGFAAFWWTALGPAVPLFLAAVALNVLDVAAAWRFGVHVLSRPGGAASLLRLHAAFAAVQDGEVDSVPSALLHGDGTADSGNYVHGDWFRASTAALSDAVNGSSGARTRRGFGAGAADEDDDGLKYKRHAPTWGGGERHQPAYRRGAATYERSDSRSQLPLSTGDVFNSTGGARHVTDSSAFEWRAEDVTLMAGPLDESVNSVARYTYEAADDASEAHDGPTSFVRDGAFAPVVEKAGASSPLRSRPVATSTGGGVSPSHAHNGLLPRSAGLGARLFPSWPLLADIVSALADTAALMCGLRSDDDVPLWRPAHRGAYLARVLYGADAPRSLFMHFAKSALDELPAVAIAVLDGSSPPPRMQWLNERVWMLNTASPTGRSFDALKLALAGALVWLIGNYVNFQPWDRDNCKLFYLWVFVYAGPVGALLAAPIEFVLGIRPGYASLMRWCGAPYADALDVSRGVAPGTSAAALTEATVAHTDGGDVDVAGGSAGAARTGFSSSFLRRRVLARAVTLPALVAAVATFAFMTLTGFLMVIREYGMNNVMFDEDHLRMGAYIAEHTPPDTVIMHRDHHIFASGSIAGRSALLAYTGKSLSSRRGRSFPTDAPIPPASIVLQQGGCHPTATITLSAIAIATTRWLTPCLTMTQRFGTRTLCAMVPLCAE